MSPVNPTEVPHQATSVVGTVVPTLVTVAGTARPTCCSTPPYGTAVRATDLGDVLALRRLLACFLLFVCLLAIPACGAPADAKGGPSPSDSATEPTAASSSSGPSPDPRPTPASSRGPARNVPPPVLPEAAKQNTAEGFEAFTQYWFDTVTYGLETGDSRPLREISLPECKMCASYLATIEKSTSLGNWSVGPKWTVSHFTSDLIPDPAGRRAAFFQLDESSSTDHGANGTDTTHSGGTEMALQAIYAVYKDALWLTAEAGGA
ncbi:DUF6318 family protein [Sinomonas terrae]|uniref:DUF6318 family protein n=1 Tax=Sinomonas terrae TaxID=2908838 RepID=UPI0021058C15|nr:DUF6318 family protein [Sinomonas terrae]